MPLRKVSRCHQDLIEILYKVAEKLYLCNIDYVMEYGTEDIDMFFSGIYKVRIKGFRDKQKVTYNILIKWHCDPQQRACFRELYHRDFLFYQLIVPALLNIQHHFKIQGLKLTFPNCIFTRIEYDKETVVMLYDDSFTYLDRFHKMDFQHASLVMKNLAKLHALSFILAARNPKTFKEILKKCGKDAQYSDPRNISKSIKSYYEASVNVVSDEETKEKLRTIIPKLGDILNKSVTPGSNCVICHGDCWTNNMFFKYCMGRPYELLFVDYQLCRLASPATDLSYFFYMCTDRDFLTQYYDRLLDIYHGTLAGVMRQSDLNVEDVFPKTIFQEHLKLYSIFGLIEALVSMKIITAATDEACKMTEMKYNSDDGIMDNVSQNYSLYVDRVNGVVNDFFERGYSLDGLMDNEAV